MKESTLKISRNLKSQFKLLIIWINLSLLFYPFLSYSQAINSPYCIKEFSSFSDRATEMTVDWNSKLIYFTGENVFGTLYQVAADGAEVKISTNFANSASSELVHNYVSTDIAYYSGNNSIYTNAEGSLIKINLSPTVSSSVAYVFPYDIGANAGMAIIGDKIYTTDGKGSANAVFEYDILANTSRIVVSGLPADSWHGLEYCDATGKLYLAISPLGIYEVNIAAGTYTLVTATLPTTSRSNFAIDPTGAYAFVHNGTTIYRYNLTTGVGEIFASSLLADNTCDLKFAPSSNDPAKYSLYIGGKDRIYEATGFVLATSSDKPTLTATQPVICPLGLQTTTISTSSTDKLNGASAWYLYSGSCGGTLVAFNTTGTFLVSPTITTTYYIRGEGACNVAPGDCGEITIIYGNIQPPITNITHIICNGEANGEIEIFASGGTPPYEYSIDNGANFQTGNLFTGLLAGVYEIVVKESNGCINKTTVTLTQPAPLTFTYTATNVSCNLGNDGSILITAVGGKGEGYEYSIDGGTSWQTKNSYTGLTAGTYSVLVRDRVYDISKKEKSSLAATCETDPVSVVIAQPTPIVFSSSKIDVSCNGGTDGSITISASGGIGGNGSGTYQYSIDGGSTWQDAALFSALKAGSYPLAVRDKESVSCIVSGETVIILEPTVISFTTSQTNISCNGGSEGEIKVTAAGGIGGAGTGTYSYSKDSGSTWQTSNTFSNLSAGTYAIVVKDQGVANCQTAAKDVIVTEPTPLSFTAEVQNISCNGNNDGQITFTASGGVGGTGSGTYDYSIDGGLIWQSSNVFDSLYAGSYNARIRDKVNTTCTSSIQSVTLTQTDPLLFTTDQINVSCSGGSDGSITITAKGGSGTGYDYSKDNGAHWQSSNSFLSLIAGDYQTIIRDQANTACLSASKTIRIEEPTLITFTVSQTNVSCNLGADGEIIVTANGGIGGAGSGTYQYSKDNGSTWQDQNTFSDLKAGTYNIRVRDAVNTSCQTAAKQVNITEPSPILVETILMHIDCFGGTNGQIEIKASGGFGGAGSGIFDYSIDGGIQWQTLNKFSNLAAGTYSVVVRDQANTSCTTVPISVAIEQPTQIEFTTQVFNVSCNGGNTGKIIISASGGIGGLGSGTYQYSTNAGYSWQDSNTFENLFADTYQVLVRDKVNTNCSTTVQEVVVSEAAMLSFTFTQHDVSCYGGDDGQIVFTASGGSGLGYVYSIDGINFQESNTFSNLSPNRYSLSIAEKNNLDCRSNSVRITLLQPTQISFTTTKTDVSCFECANGVISVSASGGIGGSGSGTYQYSIDGGTSWQDAPLFSDLKAGIYQVMVRDKVNTACSVGPQEVILTQPTPITFTTESSNINCYGAAAGEIQITASGGIGGAGSGSYQYSIDDGNSWFDLNIFTRLIAGSYKVRVRDKVNIVNLTDAQIVEITQPTELEFSFSKTDVSCNGSNDGTIVFTAIGGVGGEGSGTYSYSINGGISWQNAETFQTLSAGEYQLILRDAIVSSCTTAAVDTVLTEPSLLVLIYSKVDANCSTNDDGEIQLIVNGGTGGAASGVFEFSIDDGLKWVESSLFTDLPSGNYLIGARDKENPNCGTDFQNVFIDLISPIKLSYTATEISCNGGSDGEINLVGLGGVGYEFTIDGGEKWQDQNLFQNLSAGDYILITREKTNILCGSLPQELSLNEPTELSFLLSPKNATCEVGNDGEISVQASGGIGGEGSGTYEYSKDEGISWQTSNLFSNLVPGLYKMLVRDKENIDCLAPLQSITIYEFSTIAVAVSSTDVSCFDGTDGQIVITASGGTEYEYSIDNASSWSISNTFDNLKAGTYTILVREKTLPDCYTSPIVLEIAQPTEITFTITQINVSCFGGTNGSFIVKATGGIGGLGTGTYDYSKDGGLTWQSVSRFLNLAAGTYAVVVRDAGNTSCQTNPKDVVITQPTAISFTVNKTDLSCFESANGRIELLLTGGIGGSASGVFQFSIDNGLNWQDSNLFSDLKAGTYQAVVRDKDLTSCSSNVQEIILAEPSELSFKYTTTDASCGIDNDGEIVFSASGGIGASGSGTYQYSIDNGISWRDNATFSGLSANTYNALIRDKVNINCRSEVQSIKIKAFSAIDYTFNYLDVSCPGNADGEIEFSVSASDPYEFSIDNGVKWQASPLFQNLNGGIYLLVVRDKTTPLCESATKEVELYEAEPLTFTFTYRHESCNAEDDAWIEMKASGGESGTYEFSIDGGIKWSESGLFSKLNAGDYSLMTRDKSFVECTSNQISLSLIKGTSIEFSTEATPLSCYGFDDGKIVIDITLGNEDSVYEYSITNGVSWQTSNTFSDLGASYYFVTARQQGSSVCQPVSQGVSVSEPPLIQFDIQSKDVSCESDYDGEIVILMDPISTKTYSYTIDGGLTFQDSNTFTELAQGTFSVFAKDKSNAACVSETVLVSIQKRSELDFSVSKTNVSCTDAKDGTIAVGMGLGTDLTEYEFSNDNGSTFQSSNLFTDLAAGSYQVLVRNIAGSSCLSYPKEAIISSPNPITFSTIVTNESCGGTNDGKISVSALGGTSLVYDYSSDNGISWQSSKDIENLGVGNYEIVVRDRVYTFCLSAMSKVSVEKESSLPFTTNIQNISCYGGSDGKITIKIDPTAPVATYEYSIDSGLTWQLSAVFANLKAGSYFVVVRKAGGIPCQIAQEVILEQPEIINFSIIKTDLSCANTPNGKIEITPSGGSSGLYQYSKDNGVLWQDSKIFDNLSAGNYVLLVRDKVNTTCLSNPQSTTLSSPPAMNLSVSSYNLWCNSSADGEIHATGSGGTGILSYSIDGGETYFQNSGDFLGIDAGEYVVVLKDANGCELFYASNPVVLTQPQGVTFQNIAITYGACDGGLGSIQIDATSIFGSLLYSIDKGNTYQSSNYFGDLPSGTYYVMAKETNSCENAYAANPIELTLASELTVSISASPSDNICTNYPIVLTADGPDIALYNWSTSEQSKSIVFTTDKAQSFYFSVDVESIHGCKASDDITLNFNLGSPIDIVVLANDTACAKDILTLTAAAENAVSYLWKPENTIGSSINVQKFEAGNFMYFVEVLNNTGCTSMDSVLLVIEDCTGLNELETDKIKIDIFPNPSHNGQFNVEILGVKEDVEVWIIDFNGRIIAEDKIRYQGTDRLRKQYKLKESERGVYFIRLSTSEKVSYKRIILM